MILNNLKNLVKTLTLLGGAKGQSTNANIPAIYEIRTTSGNVLDTFLINGNYNYNPLVDDKLYVSTSQTSISQISLVLGTGTTPVTENDYCIESIISTNVQKADGTAHPIYVVDSENNKLTKKSSLVFSVKNTGSSDLSVSEVGIMTQLRTTSYNSNPQVVLLHREVFEPVTIPAGGVRTFQFDFEFTNQI